MNRLDVEQLKGNALTIILSGILESCSYDHVIERSCYALHAAAYADAEGKASTLPCVRMVSHFDLL